jgi:hypothetical protein
MFRGPDNAACCSQTGCILLWDIWTLSTVFVTGTPVHRPMGLRSRKDDETAGSVTDLLGSWISMSRGDRRWREQYRGPRSHDMGKPKKHLFAAFVSL